MMLSDVCLSRTSGLSQQQRERPRKTKICTEKPMSHVTRTPLSRSKGQRSRSPGRFVHCRVGKSGSCSGGRGNALAMRNCCYVAVCSEAQGTSVPSGEERGRGISWWTSAYNLSLMLLFYQPPFRGHSTTSCLPTRSPKILTIGASILHTRCHACCPPSSFMSKKYP